MKRLLAVLLAVTFVSLTASAKTPYTHYRSKRTGSKISRSKSRSGKSHSFSSRSPKRKSSKTFKPGRR
jgi:hypothetical protein